jgi:hypothetical protein
MKQRNAFLIGFFTTAAFCAGLAWLGGYNFDYRSPGVALATFGAFVVSISVGGMAANEV